MDIRTLEDLTEIEKQLIIEYRKLDKGHQEDFIEAIKATNKKDAARGLLKVVDLTDEEEMYLNDLMYFDSLTEKRQQEVIEYHNRRGFDPQTVESVKNMAL